MRRGLLLKGISDFSSAIIKTESSFDSVMLRLRVECLRGRENSNQVNLKPNFLLSLLVRRKF